MNLSNAKSLREKCEILKKSEWGANTDLEKVFDYGIASTLIFRNGLFKIHSIW